MMASKLRIINFNGLGIRKNACHDSISDWPKQAPDKTRALTCSFHSVCRYSKQQVQMLLNKIKERWASRNTAKIAFDPEKRAKIMGLLQTYIPVLRFV
jgi:hypothetical protein